MTAMHKPHHEETAHPMPRAHEWEMIAGFALTASEEKSQEDCMIEPVAMALKQYGLEEPLLRKACAEVEQTGEELRSLCADGSLSCVNVRVQVSHQALNAANNIPEAWRYYVIKQMASSESDNLYSMENPVCYIDVYFYQAR